MPKAKTKTQPPPEPETSEEFERFREFARQIVSVPKGEIDRRAEEYERQPKPEKGNPFKKKTIPAG